MDTLHKVILFVGVIGIIRGLYLINTPYGPCPIEARLLFKFFPFLKDILDDQKK